MSWHQIQILCKTKGNGNVLQKKVKRGPRQQFCGIDGGGQHVWLCLGPGQSVSVFLDKGCLIRKKQKHHLGETQKCDHIFGENTNAK